MSDPGQDPRHLSDEDIAALLDEAAHPPSDDIAEGQESALDLGALEALVFEGETNLANLLPGFEPDESAETEASSTARDEAATAVEPTDVPLLNSLNILFGSDRGDDVV